MGAKKRPFYRLVVADSRSARDGRIIDTLGHYNPLTEPITLVVDEEKATTWLNNGALPSDTAKRLLKQAGVIGNGVHENGQGETASDAETDGGERVNADAADVAEVD